MSKGNKDGGTYARDVDTSYYQNNKTAEILIKDQNLFCFSSIFFEIKITAFFLALCFSDK